MSGTRRERERLRLARVMPQRLEALAAYSLLRSYSPRSDCTRMASQAAGAPVCCSDRRRPESSRDVSDVRPRCTICGSMMCLVPSRIDARHVDGLLTARVLEAQFCTWCMRVARCDSTCTCLRSMVSAWLSVCVLMLLVSLGGGCGCFKSAACMCCACVLNCCAVSCPMSGAGAMADAEMLSRVW